jgi:hypothetical protein
MCLSPDPNSSGFQDLLATRKQMPNYIRPLPVPFKSFVFHLILKVNCFLGGDTVCSGTLLPRKLKPPSTGKILYNAGLTFLLDIYTL